MKDGYEPSCVGPMPPEVITKRAILARIARLFDPMGWLAPIIVLAKGIMRELWLAKTGWDEPVTPECERLWREGYSHLDCISQIKISRWNYFTLQVQFVEVHGFTDASKNAYGATVYLSQVNG